MTKRIFEFYEGKYSIVLEDGYKMTALRYGEKWNRDLIGDGMILAMLQHIESLEDRIKELENK